MELAEEEGRLKVYCHMQPFFQQGLWSRAGNFDMSIRGSLGKEE